MRKIQNTALLTVLSGFAAGCGHAGGDSELPLPTQPPPPPNVVPAPRNPVVPSLGLGGQSRELMIGASFVLVGTVNPDVLNVPSARDTTVAITWRTDDRGIVSLQPIDNDRVRISGEHRGTGWIEGRALGAEGYVYLSVLDAADSGVVSPVVVDDFRVFAHYGQNGGWAYSPEIMLHDRSPTLGSALIMVSVEIPGLQPSAPCAMLRPISAQPRLTFTTPDTRFDEFEYTIVQPGRASFLGAVAVGHLTIRLPNRTAMTLTVTGPVVTSEQRPPIDYDNDYYFAEPTGDRLTCE